MKKFKKPPIAAKIGQRVFVVWDNGLKLCGRIKRLGNIMPFNAEKLQTYSIQCDDGFLRPAHARHIKKVYTRRVAA